MSIYLSTFRWYWHFGSIFGPSFRCTIASKFSASEGFAPDPLTRGSAPGPHSGLCPQTSVIDSRSPWCPAPHPQPMTPSMGVILGGREGPGPTFLKWHDASPLYKHTKSEISLGPPHFSNQSYAIDPSISYVHCMHKCTSIS